MSLSDSQSIISATPEYILISISTGSINRCQLSQEKPSTINYSSLKLLRLSQSRLTGKRASTQPNHSCSINSVNIAIMSMLHFASRHAFRRVLGRHTTHAIASLGVLNRFKSSSLKEYTERAGEELHGHGSSACHNYVDPFDENGDSTEEELIHFPSDDRDVPTPVLLNAKEHAIGYLSKILNARVYEAAIETDLQHAKNLSAVSRKNLLVQLGDVRYISVPWSKYHSKLIHVLTSSQHLKNIVLLKREDTQPVFSFKIRGAYNKMAHLTQVELKKGVVACSAGNHAQGVALSAKMLGCRAVIVMPLATPSIKVNSVRVHGGPTVEVRLFGNNYDEAAAEAFRLMKEESMTMIHPFDDPYVIAGQGTIGE